MPPNPCSLSLFCPCHRPDPLCCLPRVGPCPARICEVGCRLASQLLLLRAYSPPSAESIHCPTAARLRRMLVARRWSLAAACRPAQQLPTSTSNPRFCQLPAASCLLPLPAPRLSSLCRPSISPQTHPGSPSFLPRSSASQNPCLPGISSLCEPRHFTCCRLPLLLSPLYCLRLVHFSAASSSPGMCCRGCSSLSRSCKPSASAASFGSSNAVAPCLPPFPLHLIRLARPTPIKSVAHESQNHQVVCSSSCQPGGPDFGSSNRHETDTRNHRPLRDICQYPSPPASQTQGLDRL